MTESSLSKGATSGAQLDEALTRLKQRGCALLVAGEAPEATYQQAARELHGTTEERRLRIHTITGEESPSEHDAWLPRGISADSEDVSIIDFRSNHRNTAAQTNSDDNSETITPMRAGPAFPPISERAATVHEQELQIEQPAPQTSVTNDEVDWVKAARPVPGLRGKRPRMVKPQGVNPNPSQAELEEVNELRETLISAIEELGEEASDPGDLRLGLSSIAPLVRTLGEERIQSLVEDLRDHVVDNNGLMFCQFPHQITTPEGTYLREKFDATVLVRRSLENGIPHAYMRFVVPPQDGITEEPVLSDWIPYGPNRREHTLRGR